MSGLPMGWTLDCTFLEQEDKQTRIVEKLEELLSDLDAGVAELKAAQKKLGQYCQSLLNAAVEGALTDEWRSRNTPTARIRAERSEREKQPKTRNVARGRARQEPA